jgi:ribosomal protein S18 acetylase RimI-like enzyme
MKREVIKWYNGLREEWGLEKIGTEPEDTEDLVTEDFSFRSLRKDDVFLVDALHRRCLEEFGKNLAETGPLTKTVINEAHAFSLYSGSSSGIVAESSGGEFAGYITGTVNDSALYIQNLEVKEEYRGLGVGEALLAKFLDSFDPNEVNRAFLDLPIWAEGFTRVLFRESFKPYTVRYWLNLRMRDRE